MTYIRYVLPTMPSNVARTYTDVLSNVLASYPSRMGEVGSINEALRPDARLRNEI